MELYLLALLILVIIYLLVALRFANNRNAHFQEVLKRARAGYKKHLRSHFWETISELSKRRDKYTCRLCGRKRPHVQLHSHHPKNYLDVLFDEKPEDLTTLCADCHIAVELMLDLRYRGINLVDAIAPVYRSNKQSLPGPNSKLGSR